MLVRSFSTTSRPPSGRPPAALGRHEANDSSDGEPQQLPRSVPSHTRVVQLAIRTEMIARYVMAQVVRLRIA
jgi:hypothetical protein